ncbi:MAG: gliding motility-associated C-terminal domain-containing protein [Opitutaceae bacterium]|nr:gliding motility-associated C-terminal domain-containing protein [Cytophagales bacterium]
MFIFNTSFAEGTKELRPDSLYQGSLQLYANNGTNATFAIKGESPNQRLNIHICEVGEIVYLGFATSPYFQVSILDPMGNPVQLLDPSGNSVIQPKLTNVQPGIILSYKQAFTGPSAISGASGYNAMSFIALTTGDYYVEFEKIKPFVPNNDASIINLIDVTVTNNGVIRNGRLWSKSWNMTTEAGGNRFMGSMYVYTTDKIVTKLEFNGIQPHGFGITSNSTGTARTGNPILDRKSTYKNNTYPEFQIFLNDPDTLCYPTGLLGEITGKASITGCPGNYCINVSVTAPGIMIFTIEANGISGFQPNTSDRSIQQNLTIGKNCVPWDGKDGNGMPIGNKATVDLSIQYINGLTNLPMYDVEDHTDGYKVSYVRPKPTTSGNLITLFWDDRNIKGGTALDGLTSPANGCSLITGCHRWKGRGVDNACNAGCPETINTWWYVKESSDTIVYNFSEQKIDANIRTPGTGKDNDTSVCASVKSIFLKGGLAGDTISKWSILSGNGSGSFLNPDSLKTVYTLSSADNNRQEIILLLSSINLNCPSIQDTLKITLDPEPVLKMPSPFSICSNNTTLTTSATFANANGIRWTGSGGKFVDSLKTTIQYFPAKKEIDSSKVKLYATTLQKTGQLCPMITDSVQISIYLPASLSMPSDTTLCFNKVLIKYQITAKAIASDSVVWSSVNVGLNPKRGLTTNLDILKSDSIKIFATAYKKGCKPIADSTKIKFEIAPKIAATALPTCFANHLFYLNGISNTPSNWKTLGNGAFLKSTDSLKNNGYTPSAADISAEKVTIGLTSKGQVFCPVADTIITLNIIPIPVIEAGPDTIICKGTSIERKVNLNPQWKYSWTSGSGSTIQSSSEKIKITPDKDSIQLKLRVSNIKNCTVKDSFNIAAITAPKIDLPDKICFYKPFNQIAVVSIKPAVGVYSWKKNATDTIVNSNSIQINSPGIYTYQYEYKTCTSSDQVKIILPTRLVVPDTSACSNSPVILTANSIIGATYNWQGTKTSSNTYSTNAGNGISNFKISVTDGNSCKDSTYVNVKVYPYPAFNLSGSDVCPGQSGLITTTLTDPNIETSYPLEFSWQKDGLPYPAVNFKELSYNQRGAFTLELRIKGCKAINSFIPSFHPAPKIDIPLTYKYCFETDPPLNFISNEFKKYSWYGEEGLISYKQFVQVSPVKDSYYILKVENNFGCKDSAALFVRKVCPPRLFVPNVMTPESHDVNAGLPIFGAHYTNFEITIFSRWGEVIFNSKDPKHIWKGEYKNENMPIGNYPWLVTYEGDSQEFKGPYKKTGEVSVIR